MPEWNFGYLTLQSIILSLGLSTKLLIQGTPYAQYFYVLKGKEVYKASMHIKKDQYYLLRLIVFDKIENQNQLVYLISDSQWHFLS